MLQRQRYSVAGCGERCAQPRSGPSSSASASTARDSHWPTSVVARMFAGSAAPRNDSGDDAALRAEPLARYVDPIRIEERSLSARILRAAALFFVLASLFFVVGSWFYAFTLPIKSLHPLEAPWPPRRRARVRDRGSMALAHHAASPRPRRRRRP